MSEQAIQHYVKFEEQSIEYLRAEIKTQMETLVKTVKAAIAEGDFNSRITELVAKLAEKDATLTARELAFKRMKTALEAK